MFDLSPQQLEKLRIWKEAGDPKRYAGCSGGRYTYCFTPTSLGIVIKVQDCLLNKEIDLSDYEDW